MVLAILSGPQPALRDSEVLTLEVVGEFLGYDTDEGIYTYFLWHWVSLFPALASVHRTDCGSRSGCGAICCGSCLMTPKSRS